MKFKNRCIQNQPIGEAENIDLKYTEYEDSTVRLIANLLSPKMLDYSNRDFAFSEFPDGIELKIYDENDNKTTITSRLCHCLYRNRYHRFTR